MTKIIKLTEADINNIIVKVIKEQVSPDFPYPEPRNRDQITQVRDKVRSDLQMGTPTESETAKREVKLQMANLIRAMENLSRVSGVTGPKYDFISDIKKIVMKFEDIFGDRRPEEEKPKPKPVQ